MPDSENYFRIWVEIEAGMKPTELDARLGQAIHKQIKIEVSSFLLLINRIWFFMFVNIHLYV